MDTGLLKEILNKIKEHETIMIFPHFRPDGDAMGTSFGLQDILQTSFPKKKVFVVGESSDFTSYLGTPDKVNDEQFKGALAISVDTASKDRIADSRHELCDFLIKMDHHVPVEDFGDLNYVDTTRPAAALIVMDLFRTFREELSMTKKGATSLFFGILTDTGRFKYSGVNKSTFESVAVLYDYGLESAPIYQYLDTKTDELTRFKGYFLQNFKKTKHGVAYIKIKPKVVKKFNISLEEATSLVNELGGFEDCPIWILFAEYEGKIVRARLRSKGPEIDKLANQYNGGGHKMACGANLGTWKNAKNLLKDADLLAKKFKEDYL